MIRECGIEVRDRQEGLDGEDEFSMDNERSGFNPFVLRDVPDSKLMFHRFYKFIEDAYTHANQTLLHLLLKDQQLIPRLRSLKHYFFLSQSSFLTHLLDLSHTELRKSAKGASIVKLQSLLDLALNSDSGLQGEEIGEGGHESFREDVKVIIAGSGLYEWLLKVVSVNGVIGNEEGELGDHEENKKEKEDKKQILGKSLTTIIDIRS